MSGRRAQTTLQPSVLRWARERAGFGMERVAAKVGVRPDRVVEWERSGRISMSQVDRLAHCTHTPVGYLYLREPPEDDLPIPDFRASGGESPRRPSPDLLETVDLLARRQAWMRNELIEDGADPLGFVGCCGRDSTPGGRGPRRYAICAIASKRAAFWWFSTGSSATIRTGGSTDENSRVSPSSTATHR